MKVSADGAGVASHAGCELLRELAAATGLVDAWDRALIGTYRGVPVHFPGQVLADLAVSIADGATSVMGLRTLRDQPALFGPVASEPTAWRVLDKASDEHLQLLRAGRAKARAAAWEAGAAPDLSGELALDFDATVVVAHSEKQDAAPTWKHTFGHHPLYCFLDRPEVSSGEALAGLLRPGNAGSNTAADHIAVLDMALESLPARARPGAQAGLACWPGLTRQGRRMLLLAPAGKEASGSASASPWARTCGSRSRSSQRRHGSRPPKPTARTGRVPTWPSSPACSTCLAGPRAPGSSCGGSTPTPGLPSPSSSLHDGWRYTAFITDTATGVVPGGIGGLELRHRLHARVEDRIRQSKAAGLNNFPCWGSAENRAWMEAALAAADLVCWSKLICFADEADIAHCEIDAFRYAILHMGARLARSGRAVFLRLDRTWAWAEALARAFSYLRAAFG